MRPACPLFLILAILSAIVLSAAGTSAADQPLTLDQVLDRARQAELTFQERLQDYVCQATTTVKEPQDDGTFKTIRVVEKTIYRKLPDKRLERCQSVIEGGRALSPAEVAEYQRNQKWEKPVAGRQFFSPEHCGNYSFELLPADTVRGLPTYALHLIPLKEEMTLVNGTIWLRQDNFEIVKLDCRPAKNPRFVQNVHMTIDFDEVQPGYWLPVELDIEARGGFLFIKKHFTVHESWHHFQFNVGLADSLFVQDQ